MTKQSVKSVFEISRYEESLHSSGLSTSKEFPFERLILTGSVFGALNLALLLSTDLAVSVGRSSRRRGKLKPSNLLKCRKKREKNRREGKKKKREKRKERERSLSTSTSTLFSAQLFQHQSELRSSDFSCCYSPLAGTGISCRVGVGLRLAGVGPSSSSSSSSSRR